MNDPFSGALIIAAVSACAGFAWSRQRRGSYFLASLTLLSLATLSGLVVALLFLTHPSYFQDDRAIPWIESLALGSLVFGGGFFIASLVLLAVASVVAVVRALHRTQHE